MGNLTDFLKLLIQEAAHPVLIGGAGSQGAKSLLVQRTQTLDLRLDAPCFAEKSLLAQSEQPIRHPSHGRDYG